MIRQICCWVVSSVCVVCRGGGGVEYKGISSAVGSVAQIKPE